MGCRLYPKTQNAEILEKLARVPEGTYGKLKEFEAQSENQYEIGSEKGYEVYCRMQENPDLGALQEFLLYGWGRLNAASVNVIERWQLDPNVGSTTNPIVVRALINVLSIDTKGISRESLEGLKWG